MIYNGHADEQDIVHLAYDLTNTNSATYPLKEMTRAANKTLKKVWAWIFEAYGGWLYDDSNNTDFAAARSTLSVGQPDYNIPPGAIAIRGVDILPPNSTIYQPLIPITEEEMRQMGKSDASFYTATGVPKYYRPIGTSAKLYPTPNYTAAQGIRMTFNRGMTLFVSTDTTKEPGFVSQFHEVVPVGVALEYQRRNALDASGSEKDMAIFEKDIKAYYSARFLEKYPSKMTIRDETSQYI